MRILALLILVTAALPLRAQPEPLPEALFPQLRDLMAAADANSPGIKTYELALEEADANVNMAKAEGRIRASTYARASGIYETRINSEAASPTDFRFGPNVSLQASLPIYNWGAIEAREEVARMRARLMQAQVENKREAVHQEVRRYFLEYLIATQAAEIARENIAYADRKVEAQEALLQSGQAARRNLMEARIFRLEREEELLNAQKQARFNLTLLRELTGLDGLEIEPVEFPEVPVMDEAALESLRRAAGSAGTTPEQQSLEAELAAERQVFRDYRARNRPRLDLVAGGMVDTVEEYQGPGKYKSVPRVWSYAGLQGSWNIFDGGSMKSAQMASMARQRRTEGRIDEARQRRLRSADFNAQEVTLASAQIQTRTHRVDLLKGIVDLMERQLADNIIPANDLFERKIELERTQVELLRAKASYLLNVAELRTAADNPEANVNQ